MWSDEELEKDKKWGDHRKKTPLVRTKVRSQCLVKDFIVKL